MSNRSTYEQVLQEQGYLVYLTSGYSMRPFIRSGEDLVYIRAKGAQRCRVRDVVLYKRDDGTYVLHRIMKVREQDYVMCGDNCWQLEPGIREDQVLGVLTKLIRNGQETDVNAPGYRTLTLLWWALYVPRAAIIFARSRMWRLWKKWKEQKREKRN